LTVPNLVGYSISGVRILYTIKAGQADDGGRTAPPRTGRFGEGLLCAPTRYQWKTRRACLRGCTKGETRTYDRDNRNILCLGIRSPTDAVFDANIARLKKG
jgi:hypothetical protein